MVYCIEVKDIASRYKFVDDEIKEIERVQNLHKDKRAEARLKAWELRAKEMDLKSVAKVHAKEQPSEKGQRRGYRDLKNLVSCGYFYIWAWKSTFEAHRRKETVSYKVS